VPINLVVVWPGVGGRAELICIDLDVIDFRQICRTIAVQ
jgi:hypothetical protein